MDARDEERLDIFDPWTDPADRPAVRSPESRWSLPPRKAQAPEREAPPPDPAEDPAGFLRGVGVPRLRSVARRLEAAQHYTTVQDLLDLPSPAIRVLIWPRPGLLDREAARILATLELIVERADAETVFARCWLGSTSDEVAELGSVPAADLTWGWVEERTVDFVQRVLEGL